MGAHDLVSAKMQVDTVIDARQLEVSPRAVCLKKMNANAAVILYFLGTVIIDRVRVKKRRRDKSSVLLNHWILMRLAQSSVGL